MFVLCGSDDAIHGKQNDRNHDDKRPGSSARLPQAMNLLQTKLQLLRRRFMTVPVEPLGQSFYQQASRAARSSLKCSIGERLPSSRAAGEHGNVSGPHVLTVATSSALPLEEWLPAGNLTSCTARTLACLVGISNRDSHARTMAISHGNHRPPAIGLHKICFSLWVSV